MLQNLTGWHFLIILVVVLLLFGAPKLPGLARSLGQSMKIFKSEIKSDATDDEAGKTGDETYERPPGRPTPRRSRKPVAVRTRGVRTAKGRCRSGNICWNCASVFSSAAAGVFVGAIFGWILADFVWDAAA